MKKLFRFLHISDLHLCLFHPLCPADATKDKSELFYQLALRALKNSISVVNRQDLDALIIAGDLFESYPAEHKVLKDVFSLLSDCNAQVIITPGNHDLYSTTYKQERLNFYGIKCSENVHIFSSPSFSSIQVNETNIYGMANTTRDIRPFELLPEINPENINIAVFHGSLLSFLPEGKEVWLPFSDHEVLNSRFDYVALGHYHSYSEIKDSQGIIRAIYPGSATPAGRSERDKRGGVIVEIEKTGKYSNVQAEFVTLSELNVKEIVLNITEDYTQEEIKRLLLSEIPEVERPHTVLNIKAEGTGHFAFTELIDSISEQFLHIYLDTSRIFSDNVDILLATHNPETIAGQFIKTIKEEMDKSDEAGKLILRNALLYGLDALRGKEIEPRYEDRKIQS